MTQMILELPFTALDAGADRRAWLSGVRDSAARAGGYLGFDRWPAERRARLEKAVREHMPELAPLIDSLAEELDVPDAWTALAVPTTRPFTAGCTQTAASGVLARNYDFDPDDCSKTVVRTDFLRPVIGMQEGTWGLLDGMNDAGLAVSIAFGGRPVLDLEDGHSVLLLARYLLETCESAEEAWERAKSFPSATTHNLTVVDSDQAYSLYLRPGEGAVRRDSPTAANHQDDPEHEGGEDSRLREAVLDRVRRAATVPDLIAALLTGPLYRHGYGRGFGTVYTAAYVPREGRVEYHWPETAIGVSFEDFQTMEWTVDVEDRA
ncbi:C45 family autoproteolytic acyltransferase/hydolase [Salininema proteolyticum]|uniref:C45 family autoproteolytic acyltransferase/hydrolase n=1 Tax=Salininema proteolyticum TaxID=1607685 RepID=A0ABV8TU33_9ACTN